MAVFFLNNCAFPDCGLKFSSLSSLIEHIEETHIDGDPQAVEEIERLKPSYLPLSCVLRHHGRIDGRDGKDARQRKRLRAQSPKAPLAESALCGSGVDSVLVKSEVGDTEESTKVRDRLPLMLTMTSQRSQAREERKTDRTYTCSVPGCNKTYKNVSGIKYHSQHGHKSLKSSEDSGELQSRSFLLTNTVLHNQSGPPTKLRSPCTSPPLDRGQVSGTSLLHQASIPLARSPAAVSLSSSSSSTHMHVKDIPVVAISSNLSGVTIPQGMLQAFKMRATTVASGNGHLTGGQLQSVLLSRVGRQNSVASSFNVGHGQKTVRTTMAVPLHLLSKSGGGSVDSVITLPFVNGFKVVPTRTNRNLVL